VATDIIRFPPVAFAYVIQQLRRVPGVRWVEERGFWIALLLLAASGVALFGWASQKSPQRISMAELVAGNLAPLQDWIIVSGELTEQPSPAGGYRYVLTDPSVADANINVTSSVRLASGPTTVSGMITGGHTRAHEGFIWIAQLRADPVLAREPDPPWIAIGLASIAAVIVLGSRTTYPFFFRDPPLPGATQQRTIDVGVRRGWPPPSDETERGILELRPRAPVELHVPGAAPQILRLHSAHSAADVGELRGLRASVPALVVRPSSGELTFSFASTADRDAAYHALVEDVENPSAPPLRAASLT
jgi:hypothetical protein